LRLNSVEQFFDLSQPEARRALETYRKFAEVTEQVGDFFSKVKRLEQGLGVSVPELKQPPASLAKTLYDYVSAPDFAQQQRSRQADSAAPKSQPTSASTPQMRQQNSNGLIDVFNSPAPTNQRTPNPTGFATPSMNNNSAQFQQQGSFTNTSQQDMFGFQQPLQQMPPQQQQKQIVPTQATVPARQQSQFSDLDLFGQPSQLPNVAQSRQVLPAGSYSQPVLPSSSFLQQHATVQPMAQPQRPMQQQQSNSSFQTVDLMGMGSVVSTAPQFPPGGVMMQPGFASPPGQFNRGSPFAQSMPQMGMNTGMNTGMGFQQQQQPMFGGGFVGGNNYQTGPGMGMMTAQPMTRMSQQQPSNASMNTGFGFQQQQSRQKFDANANSLL
jgi:hypothetical protein